MFLVGIKLFKKSDSYVFMCFYKNNRFFGYAEYERRRMNPGKPVRKLADFQHLALLTRFYVICNTYICIYQYYWACFVNVLPGPRETQSY